MAGLDGRNVGVVSQTGNKPLYFVETLLADNTEATIGAAAVDGNSVEQVRSIGDLEEAANVGTSPVFGSRVSAKYVSQADIGDFTFECDYSPSATIQKKILDDARTEERSFIIWDKVGEKETWHVFNGIISGVNRQLGADGFQTLVVSVARTTEVTAVNKA